MFADLIMKYSKTVIVRQIPSGEIDKGFLIPVEPVDYETRLAILPMSAKELQKYEAGMYTSQDKTIYTHIGLTGKRLSDNEVTPITLREGDQIIENNKTFTLKSVKDYTDFSDFRKYVGKKEVVKSND